MLNWPISAERRSWQSVLPGNEKSTIAPLLLLDTAPFYSETIEFAPERAPLLSPSYLKYPILLQGGLFWSAETFFVCAPQPSRFTRRGSEYTAGNPLPLPPGPQEKCLQNDCWICSCYWVRQELFIFLFFSWSEFVLFDTCSACNL